MNAETLKLKISSSVRKLIMPILLLALISFFAVICPDTFFTWYSFRNMLSQTSYVVIAAVGLSFVMLAGGIDLSIGYTMSVVGVVAGILMVNYHFPVLPAVLICLALGALMGLFNGLICVKLGVFPLIITLATSMIFQGISFILSDSKTIIGFSRRFTFIGQGYLFGAIPICAVIAAAIVILAMVVLSRTYFGRYTYAIGGNEEAARLAGINTDRIKIILYTICGLCSALAGLVLVARSAFSSSNVGPGTEFTALSGCILGGITLAGGEGNVGTIVIGVFIITVLGNGMQLMDMGTYPQYIVKGLVLVGALAFDIYRKKKKPVFKQELSD